MAYITYGNLSKAFMPSISLSTGGKLLYSNILVSGVNKVVDSWLDGTISSYSNDTISYIGDGAFLNCCNLSEVYLPNCSLIGTDAFYGYDYVDGYDQTTGIPNAVPIKYITSDNLGLCEEVSYHAFYNATELSVLELPKCSVIGPGAFEACFKLGSISLPLLTTIDEYTFAFDTAEIGYEDVVFNAKFDNWYYSTYGVSFYRDSTHTMKLSVNLPEVSTVRECAFCGNENLVSIELPKCTYIESRAFDNCTLLSEVSLPLITELSSGHIFRYCTNLKSIYMPNLSAISGAGVFSECRSLSNIDLPNLTYLGGGGYYDGIFMNCSSLTEINLPVCSSVGIYCFGFCNSLTTVSIPSCLFIGNSAFTYCSNLTSLYLGGSTVCSLGGSWAFYRTPMQSSTFTGSFGSIYVPASLLSSYKTAQNWSYYSNRFVGV